MRCNRVDEGSADNQLLKEVVITAQKRTERLEDIPVAAQVVSSQALAAANVADLSDLNNLDDGKGIDEMVLADGGRAGHYGLRGMRERAELIGAKLSLWSARDSGTEVDLIIAASRAYAKARAPGRGVG